MSSTFAVRKEDLAPLFLVETHDSRITLRQVEQFTFNSLFYGLNAGSALL